MDVNSIIGKQFGRLKAVSKSDRKDKSRRPYINCVCECGTHKEVLSYNLTAGDTISCGCRAREGMRLGNDRILQLTKRLFRHVQARAKTAQMQCTLTFDEFKALIIKPCHYCGCLPSAEKAEAFIKGRKQQQRISATVVKYNGLDRLDNNNGYSISNVVPCCKTCNFAKRAMSYQEFKAWIVRTYNHLHGQ